MKHAVILAHPDPKSFNATVARTYCEAVEKRGHETLLRDLYRMDFDPRLKAAERPDALTFAPADDVRAERETLKDADVFAFVYPLWFNAPPAILKGYIDRVFGAGFGYRYLHDGGEEPLLTGRKMISFSSSGSTQARLEAQGSWISVCQLFDEYFAQMCGLEVLDHVHFPSIVFGLDKRWVDENLGVLEASVKRYFPRSTQLR